MASLSLFAADTAAWGCGWRLNISINAAAARQHTSPLFRTTMMMMIYCAASQFAMSREHHSWSFHSLALAIDFTSRHFCQQTPHNYKKRDEHKTTTLSMPSQCAYNRVEPKQIYLEVLRKYIQLHFYFSRPIYNSQIKRNDQSKMAYCQESWKYLPEEPEQQLLK